ncbi:hypothetical protein [Granulosicoccus antarcticus]|nr:hypothetical protein [Granulosicoccus antarcticus]
MASAQAADDSPLPMNLRQTVYSTTAAELFWDRTVLPENATGNLTYRVSMDDIAVREKDYGISYYTDLLAPGQNHEFEVEAILDEDEVIARGTVIVNTQPDTHSSVAKPTNVHAVVYSLGVFEIFWDRAAEPLSYEISNSEAQLLSASNGTSAFFDHHSALEEGMESIELAALDQNGNRSESVLIPVFTGEGSTDNEPDPGQAYTLFSDQGAMALLKQINHLAIGNPGNTEFIRRFVQITGSNYAPVSDLWDKGFVITPINSDGYDTLSGSLKKVDCPDGGRYEVNELSNSSSRNQTFRYDMQGCDFDGVRHTGKVHVYRDEDSINEEIEGSFSNYTLDYEDGHQLMLDTGWTVPELGSAPPTDLLSDSGTHTESLQYQQITGRHLLKGRYTITEADGNTTIVENALHDWTNRVNASNCLQLSMRVTAPWTEYEPLQIDTLDENGELGLMCDNLNDSPWFSDGMLMISDDLGQSMSVEAQGEAGYTLSITDETGATTQHEHSSWSDSECTLLENSESVNCVSAPPLY